MSALESILNVGLHPGQLYSIEACSTLRDWLSLDDQNQIHLWWCPGHSGVPENESVDQRAKAGLSLPQPDTLSFSVARERTVSTMIKSWRKRMTSRSYLKSNNVMLHDGDRQKITHIAKRHPLFKVAGQNNRHMAALV